MKSLAGLSGQKQFELAKNNGPFQPPGKADVDTESHSDASDTPSNSSVDSGLHSQGPESDTSIPLGDKQAISNSYAVYESKGARPKLTRLTSTEGNRRKNTQRTRSPDELSTTLLLSKIGPHLSDYEDFVLTKTEPSKAKNADIVFDKADLQEVFEVLQRFARMKSENRFPTTSSSSSKQVPLKNSNSVYYNNGLDSQLSWSSFSSLDSDSPLTTTSRTFDQKDTR